MRSSDRETRQATPPGDTPLEGVEGVGGGRRGRGWKLFVAWVLVPPMLLCMAELGLRLAGFGIPMQLFVSRELRGEDVRMTNRAFFQQFYTLPIVWAPHEFSMSAAKPPDRYRVFVFGSSAAEGVPAPDFSFSRILGTMLRARPEGQKVEIYSLAMAGANSHVMRAAAKACAQYEPDLFLVYMGNNELNPSVTQRMVWDSLPPRLALTLLHATIALNDLRLVQLLNGIKRPADPGRPGGNPENVRDPERAYRYFEANVNDICAFAKAAGARVMLCTVGSRLREWVPQEAPPAGPERDADYGEGNALRAQGRFQEALAAYTRAESTGGGHAGLAYGIACCRDALGEYAEARRWYIRARDLDAKRYRPRDRINSILRETAAARAGDGVRLADSAQSFADASPHGIEGPELFLDHVHLSFEGNHVLARSVLETLARMDLRFADANSAPPSAEACRVRLAMTPPDLRDQLAATLNSDAFMEGQSKTGLERAVAELDAQIGPGAEGLRLEGCRRALREDPGNELVRTRLVQLLMNTGDTAGALEEAKLLAAEFPHSCQAHRFLAQLFAMAGDKKRAIETMRLVLAWHPDDAEAHLGLGQFLSDENQPEAALAALRASFRLSPRAQAQCGIARVLTRRGDLSGALEAYRLSLELNPKDNAVFEELVTVLCDADRLAEAKSEMKRRRAAGLEISRQVQERLNGAATP